MQLIGIDVFTKEAAATRVDISSPDGTRTLTGLASGVSANDAATDGQVRT